MKWLVAAVCLIQVAQFAFASGVPVFIWGDIPSQSAPALNDQATSSLEAVLADETSSKVIFVESQLNSDDFNYCSWQGKACFQFLGQQTSKFYSPSIKSAEQYLRSRVWNGAVKTVQADQDFSVAAGETVFVYFRDGADHPTQNDRLAAHDAAIARIVARVGDKGITFVYTAIEDHLTHKRVARQTTNTADVGFLSRGQNYILRLGQVQWIANKDADPPSRQNISLTTAEATFTKGAVATTATLLITSTPALQFDLVQEGGHWQVSQLLFDGKNYTSGTTIGANDGFSFACTPEVQYQSPGETAGRLVLTGLQMEVNLNRETTTANMVFSEAWNCVGFTSAGIWGGLFVTILLLAIMTIGISWMLDIKTMDRFDDPKGKTITINAQD